MLCSRQIFNVSCDHHALYSLSGVHVPDFENWPVITETLGQQNTHKNCRCFRAVRTCKVERRILQQLPSAPAINVVTILQPEGTNTGWKLKQNGGNEQVPNELQCSYNTRRCTDFRVRYGFVLLVKDPRNSYYLKKTVKRFVVLSCGTRKFSHVLTKLRPPPTLNHKSFPTIRACLTQIHFNIILTSITRSHTLHFPLDWADPG